MKVAVVDIHAHYLSRRCLDLGGYPPGLDITGPEQSPAPVFVEQCTDLEQRTAWMNRSKIDLQILSPELRFVAPFLGGREEASWAEVLNDSAAADIKGQDRFAALALIPMADGRIAAEELERATGDLGLCGGLIHSRPPGGLAARHLEPLWRTASELDAPLVLHSLASGADDRLTRFSLDIRVGRCHDVSAAAAELIFGGILDRFSNLKVVLVTGGGSLPYLTGRLDRDYQLRSEARSSSRLPSDYMRAFYFDSLVYGSAQLTFLIEMAGSDRVMIGSDWPAPLWEDDPVEFVRASCGRRLSTEEVTAVMGETAKRLFSV